MGTTLTRPLGQLPWGFYGSDYLSRVGDPTQSDPTRPDPTRPDPTRPDPTRPDPTRPDPTRPDPTRPDPTRTDPSDTGKILNRPAGRIMTPEKALTITLDHQQATISRSNFSGSATDCKVKCATKENGRVPALSKR